MIQKHLPVQRITQGPKHHFFGYFDKFPWDKSGRRLLAQEIPFTARQPLPGEKATLGMIELTQNNRFVPLAETDAWCWQQGCMFQWLNDSETKVIFNDREGDYFVSRILDVESGKTRTLCRPVYCLSPDGRWAMSLNFSRLDRERPGYGYPGASDPNEKVKCPDDEGIWLVDLKNNTAKLVVSIAQVQCYAVSALFLRLEQDTSVCLVFITNMAQFACEGYGVDALDFIVKPVSYADFYLKFSRAVSRADASSDDEFHIRVAGGVRRVRACDIAYVEVRSHSVLYHTEQGVIESRDTLATVEERLRPARFLR